MVADVARGSPAEEAGLEPGDELREVGGKPIVRLAREKLEPVLDDGAAAPRRAGAPAATARAAQRRATLAILPGYAASAAVNTSIARRSFASSST